MNIRCSHCKSQFNIPDDKLPKDRDAVFTCPKCKEKNHISPAKTPEKNGPETLVSSGSGFSPEGRERALVLVAEGPFQKAAHAAVRQLGFTKDTAADQAAAAKKIAYHVYPLIILEQGFDRGATSILSHMNALDMSIRRMSCLVLVGQQFKTGDPMAALHASVNYVAGPDSTAHLPAVLAAALQDHKNFYRVYMDAMKTAGKA
ncbi:MAG TPA: zinc-ribbon domain-containing protein [Desulfotignum sp.]|nr:zinc-ribbon domain-containing protein [Desulfotignum sp.]